MNTVELPKTSAIGLNISGFFGCVVTLFAGFPGTYCIGKHPTHSCGRWGAILNGIRGDCGEFADFAKTTHEPQK
jgi:hypothetical protein